MANWTALLKVKVNVKRKEKDKSHRQSDKQINLSPFKIIRLDSNNKLKKSLT